MKQKVINEQQLKEVLNVWKSTGRNLINLPQITKKTSGLRISIISIDNTINYIYEDEFPTYRMLLSWFGDMLDQLNEYGL